MQTDRNDGNGLARKFLPAALAVGFLFVLFTPPFHVPDEPAHFFRGYAISQGIAFAVDGNGKPGAVLPRSLPDLATRYLGPTAEERRRNIAPGEVAAGLTVPLRPDEKIFLPAPPTRQPSPVSFSAFAYPPFLYAPQAAATGMGRVLGLPPLVLLYLARTANMLTGVLLLWLGIRWLPFGGRTAVAIALFPMSLVLRSSASNDAVLLPLVFVFVAAILRVRATRGAVTLADTAVLSLCAFLMATGRVPYATLALFVLLLPFRPGESLRTVLAQLAVLASAAGGLVVSRLWIAMVPPLEVPANVTISSGDRMRQALDQPFGFLSGAVDHFIELGPAYAREIVGNLGWLDHPLPLWLTTGIMCGTVLIAVLDGPSLERLGLASRGWLIFVCGSALLGLAFVIHLGTPFERGFLSGFQGRYVIPMVWPFLMALGLGRREDQALRTVRIALPVIAALGILGAAVTTAGFYTG